MDSVVSSMSYLPARLGNTLAVRCRLNKTPSPSKPTRFRGSLGLMSPLRFWTMALFGRLHLGSEWEPSRPPATGPSPFPCSVLTECLVSLGLHSQPQTSNKLVDPCFTSCLQRFFFKLNYQQKDAVVEVHLSGKQTVIGHSSKGDPTS